MGATYNSSCMITFNLARNIYIMYFYIISVTYDTSWIIPSIYINIKHW